MNHTTNVSKSAHLYDECPFCKSTNLIRITQPEERTSHYGRLKCGDCGKHIQWLRDPSITLQWQQRAAAIDQILADHSGKLTRWASQQFLPAIREKRHLSPNEQDILNGIGLKCLGQRICIASDAPPPKTKNPNPMRSRF